MVWKVHISRKVEKAKQVLPGKVIQQLHTLILEIEKTGPVRGDWPNYSKLSANKHHCHLKKGQPTYVAVWEEKDDTINLVEVIYAGTHEKAPY